MTEPIDYDDLVRVARTRLPDTLLQGFIDAVIALRELRDEFQGKYHDEKFRAERAEAENAALRHDRQEMLAEATEKEVRIQNTSQNDIRYRWLRDNPRRGRIMEGCYHEVLDDAIDAALLAGKEKT